jgi:hypothetical protein
MKSKEEHKELSRIITERFLQLMDVVLRNNSRYKIASQRQFALSVGLLPPHINALQEDKNRCITLINALKICERYNFSANYLILGTGSMYLNLDEEQATIEYKVARLEKLVMKKITVHKTVQECR